MKDGIHPAYKEVEFPAPAATPLPPVQPLVESNLKSELQIPTLLHRQTEGRKNTARRVDSFEKKYRRKGDSSAAA